MKQVIPTIQPINEKTIIPLGSIPVFTLWNQGTTNVTFGFGDVTIVLKPGQNVTYDAGADTLYATDSKLYIDFVPVGSNDVNNCLLQFNKLTKASQATSNLVEK